MELILELIKNKTIIRYQVFRKVFEAFADEDYKHDYKEFTSDLYSFGFIVGGSELPDGDVLLQIREVEVSLIEQTYYTCGWVKYYKLSDIRIVEFNYDKTLIEEMD